MDKSVSRIFCWILLMIITLFFVAIVAQGQPTGETLPPYPADPCDRAHYHTRDATNKWYCIAWGHNGSFGPTGTSMYGWIFDGPKPLLPCDVDHNNGVERNGYYCSYSGSDGHKKFDWRNIGSWTAFPRER